MEFNLDVLLEKKGLGVREAARICELSYPTVQKIASNKSTQVSLRTIEKLCNGLDVEYADLLRIKAK